MSNIFTRFLGGVGDGLLTPKGGLADWRHASRLFIPNYYRLAPRTKFLFYVRFELDKSVITSNAFTNKHADEVGYLIKSTDLPKFKFDSVTKNQYNRKKIIYKNFTYEPIAMTFRDDSHGIMNALMALYMGSYVQDRLNPEAAFSRTNLRPAGTNLYAFRYGLDKQGKTVDFIKSISIYTMSRRRFQGYTLLNPKITSWAHGSGDYTASEFNEMTMNIEYESVSYTTGNVSPDNPKGFATLYYDSVPSPLTVAGGGVGNLFGEGGVLDGLESVFGNVAGGSAFSSPGNFLSNAISAVNTAKNIGKLSSSSLKGEIVGLISNPSTISGIVNTVGGLVGAAFPKSGGLGGLGGLSSLTSATQKKIVPPADLGEFL
jgi:hypothetical protein